jgi:exoribonuclease-2
MRAARGAVTQRRGEWKVKVKNGEITVQAIDPDSPARRIVSEMMILANALAAEYADREDVPILFRTQDAPLEPLPSVEEDDPLAFERIRRFLKPASLSLFPAEHFGLGLDAYTQLTSPLRRFADLVTQRQLLAHLAGENPPYTREELLTVLATAEAVERDIRQVEMRSGRRWLLEYLLRYRPDEELEVLVLEATHGGYRVELVEWGALAFLASRIPFDPGARVRTRIKEADPRRGRLRLRPAGL